MRKKKHPDLPPVSDPNYVKLWKEKHKEHVVAHRRKKLQQQKEADPNFWRKYYTPERKAKAADYRSKNKKVLMEKQWKKRGIIDLTYERFIADVEQAGSCCQICNKHTKLPQADHCHSSGKYRGVLCKSCNLSLGVYENNKEKFEIYLKNFSVLK